MGAAIKSRAIENSLNGGLAEAALRISTVAFYLILGLAFLALLGHTLLAQPLVPFRMDSLEWTSAWLLTTIGDYYVATLCLCGIIVATDGPAVGGAWTLAACLLGSPCACVWVAWRIWAG